MLQIKATHHTMRTTLITLIVGLLAISASGQTYELTKFDMSVSGTSTLHDWTSEVTKVYGEAEVAWSDGQLASIDKLALRIPAEGIVSTKGRIMDNKTYDALKSEEHPNIRFQLQQANVQFAQGNYDIQATGWLTVAGERKSIRLTAKAQPIAGGALTFTGAYTLKMTDYGMEPPTALMGSIKTGDEVTINYNVTLGPKASD